MKWGAALGAAVGVLAGLVPAVHAAGGLAAPVPIATRVAAEWHAVPADGVELHIGSDPAEPGALRMDFDFKGGGGYAVAHRAVALDLPAHWRFHFRLKGACKPNNLEFKLLDASGDNVWWDNQRDHEFPAEWADMTIRQRDVSFAWGPLGGGEPRHVAALEFAVTAGEGGRGTVWIEGLELQPLPPPDTTQHALVATASSGRGTASLAVDGKPGTAWESARDDAEPWLQLDLGAEREFGGLVLDWASGRHARAYTVELSSDARAWRVAHAVVGGNGGRDYVDLHDSEARYVRVHASRFADPRGGVALCEATLEPLAWAATPNDFFAHIAHDAPRGSYPRACLGEMTYWTVVGQDFDTAEGLFDEYGRIECGKGAWTLEPFVRSEGRLVTWNDGEVTQALREGHLPMPVATWRRDSLQLTIEALAIGEPGHSALLARYHLANLGRVARRDTLYLALRPFQVNPPSQFLNTPGGVAAIRSLDYEGRIVRVNGERGVASLDPPSEFGAASFDQGDISEYLRAGRLPRAQRMPDAGARASGALAYVCDVPPGGEREIAVVVPLHDPPVEPAVASDSAAVRRFVTELTKTWTRRWRTREDAVTVDLPDSDVVNALKAQLAYVLINRSGPAIQPGTRAYARSWIRDGCLTSSALLRLGETRAVRQFIDWYVPHQYPNGKAPCCVDQRGADPVPEHDSSGELIYLIAEYYRYTGDRAYADSLWPHVRAAAAYLDTLRAERRTSEWRTPANAPYFGILPPSISHEGYSAKPMHSYWDDFFALRGFKDAAFLAAELGKPERAALAHDRDEFQHDLVASLAAAMQAHHIDYLPGCADLGDFDATSTSIGLSPADAAGVLPKGALERTYEKYWTNFTRRRDGAEPWDAYTPYEWRNVGAMVRLGWRERAYEALQWLMQGRRPAGFEDWAEVVWHDPRVAKFIGDMPHTWVGTDYVRSVLDMLAYEREADSSLVIAAGVPRAWLAGTGVAIQALHTRWGTVNFTLDKSGGATTLRIDSTDLRVPPGGIVLAPPVEPATPGAAAAAIDVNGERRPWAAEVVIHRLPATVTWGVSPRPATRRSRRR